MATKIEGLKGIADLIVDEAVVEQNTMLDNIAADADADCPVGLTGELKASQVVKHADSTNLVGEVAYTAPHGIYVHEGTDKMSPRPWLLNATDKEMNRK